MSKDLFMFSEHHSVISKDQSMFSKHWWTLVAV